MKGLIEIYTGEGKGKTTSALGLVIRARGHRLKIAWASFHKEPQKYKYGEFSILRKIGIDVFHFAKKHPYFSKNVRKESLRKACIKGLEFIKKLFKEGKYQIIVLDEILISLREGYLKEKEILELMKNKPKTIELVLTGRGATKKIIKEADLVSYIKKIKHPYDRGISYRKGIEY